MHVLADDLQARKKIVAQPNDHAANSTIADEQVRTSSYNSEGRSRFSTGSEHRCEISFFRRLDKYIRLAAYTNRGALRERFIAHEHRFGRDERTQPLEHVARRDRLIALHTQLVCELMCDLR